MRDLIVAVLGGLVLWGAITCAVGKRGGGPDVAVHVDNRFHSPVNLVLFDADHGTVLGRLHNLSFGHSEREVSFRRVDDTALAVAVDVHGQVAPVPIGGASPQTIRVRKPRDVVCVTVGPRRTQDMLYMHSCAG